MPSSSKMDEGLRSPLAKRKKLAAERTGYSRLKEGITADELLATKDETASNESGLPSPKIVAQENIDEQEDEGDDEDDDEEEEEEEDEEDDFLARELEEEWG